jgi:hypothetical protein
MFNYSPSQRDIIPSGGENIELHPIPDLGPLEWINTKVPTPFGVIEVEVESRSGKMRGQAKIPKGIQAEIHGDISLL